MVKRYRFNFESYQERYYDASGNIKYKDEMIWDHGNLLIGISKTTDQFIINHYNASFDKSEYILVEDTYNLVDYCDDWWDHKIKLLEPSLKKHREKISNV